MTPTAWWLLEGSGSVSGQPVDRLGTIIPMPTTERLGRLRRRSLIDPDAEVRRRADAAATTARSDHRFEIRFNLEHFQCTPSESGAVGTHPGVRATETDSLAER